MSQQMFDEEQRGYQSGYTPAATYEEGPDYRPPINESQGYKLGQYQFTARSTVISAGQRLALAIVSVAILVPITGILLGDSGLAFFEFVGRLIALGAVCLTVMVINYIFNRGH
jgi:hypothetical protein